MSVLLIGAASDTYTHCFRVRRKKKTVKEVQKQEEYRRVLTEQVHEKCSRRSKQKQFQKWMDLKRQQTYSRYFKHKNNSHRKDQRVDNQEQNDNYQYSSFIASPKRQEKIVNKQHNQTRGQRKESALVSLPPIHPFQYQTAYLKAYETPAKKNSSILKQFPRRVKTQSQAVPIINSSQHQYNPQNGQIWLQQMRSYEDKKISQVYQLLNQSVEILHGRSQYNQVLQPQQAEKYNYSLARQQKSNLSQENDFLELPPQVQVPTQYHNQDKRQRQWKAWYNRQKLEILRAYVRKERISSQLQHKILFPSHKLSSQIQKDS